MRRRTFLKATALGGVVGLGFDFSKARAETLIGLKQLARGRLEMSSARVEILMEDAISAGCPPICLALQVRSASVPGVSTKVLARLADDIEMLATSYPPDERQGSGAAKRRTSSLEGRGSTDA